MPQNVEEQSKDNTPFVIPSMCCHEYARIYVSSLQVDQTQGTLILYIQFVVVQLTNVAILPHVPVPQANRQHQYQKKVTHAT